MATAVVTARITSGRRTMKPGNDIAKSLRSGSRTVGTRLQLDLRQAIAFDEKPTGVEVSAKSSNVLRAIAKLLNEHPQYVLMVAVRPTNASSKAAQQALSGSFAVVQALRTFTHRDEEHVAVQTRGGRIG